MSMSQHSLKLSEVSILIFGKLLPRDRILVEDESRLETNCQEWENLLDSSV